MNGGNQGHDRDERDPDGPDAAATSRPDDPGAGGEERDGPDPEIVEREARRRLSFDLATAVGHAAGGGLKGASPVPAARQLALEAAALLAAHLADAEGSLSRVLLSRLEDDPPLLDRHRGQPRAALAEVLDRALATPSALADLVREVDARWGRDYGERPRFERDGRPAAADDPYTEDGVRDLLSTLRGRL